MARSKRKEPKDNPYARRMAILQIVFATKGKVRTSDLAARFNIEPNLLAYDLRQLEEMGLVERGYGWVRRRIAAVDELFEGSEYMARMQRSREAKELIAGYIAKELIQPGDQVVVDAGTTAFFVGRHLVELGKDVTLWTNNLPLFLYALVYSNMVCHLVGGTASRAHAALVGEEAARQIADVKFDWAVVTPKGIVLQDLETARESPLGTEIERFFKADMEAVCVTLLNEDLAQHPYKGMMVRNANRVAIAADKEKFAAVGYPFLTILIPDKGVPAGAVRTRGAILPLGAPELKPKSQLEFRLPGEVVMITDASLDLIAEKSGLPESHLKRWSEQGFVRTLDKVEA